MIRRFEALTMTATNVSCGIGPWRGPETRESSSIDSVYVDKAVHSAVNPARSTLGDTDDDMDSERSAKGRLRKFARRVEFR